MGGTVFIRLKKIKKHNYAYLVENNWTGDSCRQKVKAYVGKVVEASKDNGEALLERPLADLKFPDAVTELVRWELRKHGFTLDGSIATRDSTTIDLAGKTVLHKGRPACIKLNNGFLCSHTLQEALNYVHDDDNEVLALKLVSAGIDVTPEVFVALHEKIAPAPKPVQIYY
ncbi:hypothetical protein HY642_06070 [Candidatus Woesearchaeota archaeon]|nr:hypothetical protein [Candidatus Woesearchaeota archaeon]